MNLDEFIPPVCEYPVKIAAVGDAGIHCLDVIGGEKLKGIDLIAINTNRRVLGKTGSRSAIVIGEGSGAGGDPELGRQAAEENASLISLSLSGAKTMILIAGMGGGTGTGASPVVARLATEKGSTVIGVVTFPFSFEGAARQQIARTGISRLRETVDSLIVLENDRLLRFVERPPSIEQVYLLAAKAAAWRVLSCIL
jgi:cell division protein FtsZ